MTQVYDISAEEIRELVKQYIEHGVISRAIQCYERLLWLGKLQQREYLIKNDVCAAGQRKCFKSNN